MDTLGVVVARLLRGGSYCDHQENGGKPGTMKHLQTLNYIFISIYILTLSWLWISQSPDPISQQTKLRFQNSDLVFEPIETVKPEIYLTNLNKEIAKTKSGSSEGLRPVFIYYYVGATAYSTRKK